MTVIYFKGHGGKILKVGKIVISFCTFLWETRNKLCYFGTIENDVNGVEVINFKRFFFKKKVFLREIYLLHEEQLKNLQINYKKPRFRGLL